jgi:hypothetical protein
MTAKEELICNTKANAEGGGQAQPMPTGKKADELTAEQWEKLRFGWKVHALAFQLEYLLPCSRRERKQLLRFVDAFNGMVNVALNKLYYFTGMP